MNSPPKEKMKRDLYLVAIAPVIVTGVTIVFERVIGSTQNISANVCGWERKVELVETMLASTFAYYSSIRWRSLSRMPQKKQ